MAKIDLTIPSLAEKFVDLRDPIPGDSYNWSWTRPLAQVKYLAIHHTAGPDTQTPQQIANFHVNSNGWGGIGYHFLIGKDGMVYYVGDISTARANVANLNEQVLGICLIGSFINGKQPTPQQIDSTRKLCDFFINHYPALVNVQSWDAMRGHKDLPGQSTACPGDNWPQWRSEIITKAPVDTGIPGQIVFNGSSDRSQKIADLYRNILGREPDQGGLQTYASSPATIEQIMKSIVESQEHKNVLSRVQDVTRLETQVSNLQDVINNQKLEISNLNASMSALNQQIELLNNQLIQKELEINALKTSVVVETNPPIPSRIPTPTVPTNGPSKPTPPKDTTFTLVDALFNLYKLFFPVQGGK